MCITNFLDNSVEQGMQPRTVAFGRNGGLTILDIERLMDIDKFRRINVDATHPDDVYIQEKNPSPQDNMQFLGQCIQRLDQVEIANFETGAVCARIKKQSTTEFDQREFEKTISNQPLRSALTQLIQASKAQSAGIAPPKAIEQKGEYTLGQWKSGAV